MGGTLVFPFHDLVSLSLFKKSRNTIKGDSINACIFFSGVVNRAHGIA